MKNNTAQINVRVSQMGSRERYAMARALHKNHMLELFCTDFWNNFGTKMNTIASLCNSKILDKIAHNFHAELPNEKIRAFNFLGMRARLAYKWAGKKSNSEIFNKYLQYGKAFCSAINRLPKGNHNVFLGYSTASLESIEHEHKLGNLAILNQLEPGIKERTLIAEEKQQWPGWDLYKNYFSDEYYQRLSAEWEAADLIIVNSKFSQSSLLEQEVPLSKIEVIPLAMPQEELIGNKKKRQYTGGVLRVLWLSSVILRKGIPYFLEAARLLKNEPVKFSVVGKIGITKLALETAPANVEFIGHQPYSSLDDIYEQSDVFLLPTISEGFSRAQLEAMAHGLPVIITPNCGEVVSSGEDGYIVPIRNPQAIAEAIQKFINNPELVKFMSDNALKKVKLFSLDALGERLHQVIESAYLKK